MYNIIVLLFANHHYFFILVILKFFRIVNKNNKKYCLLILNYKINYKNHLKLFRMYISNIPKKDIKKKN